MKDNSSTINAELIFDDILFDSTSMELATSAQRQKIERGRWSKT
jgi:hypothetical protein